MADPFSIIAVAQTGLEVAQVLTKLIKKLRKAPNELLALSNEVWNLQLILDNVHELQVDSRLDKADAVNALVYQTRIKLDGLNEMIKGWGRLSQYNDSFLMGKKDRFLWLKDKDRVIELQAELRELRSGLSMAVGTKTCSMVSRIEVDIQSLMTQLSDFSVETSKSTHEAHDSDSLSLSAINKLRNSQEETREVLRNMMQAMSNLNPDSVLDKRFDKCLESQSPNFQAATNLSLTPLAAGKSPPRTQFLSLGIEKRGTAVQICPPDCACTCHTRKMFRTPQMLQQITGRLLLGYSGRPTLSQGCISSCLRSKSASMQMQYFFPKWFVASVISLSMFSTMLNAPTFIIKIRRVVPEMSQIFSLSRSGDANGVRSLFDNRLASPDDVHIRGAWTPLHFAVDHGCVEVCRLLLDCGADPNWEDATGTTPIDFAWRNILHLRTYPPLSETFSVLFPSTEFIQERRFTRVHRLIIDLEVGCIEKELISNPQSIHALDIDGWAPLHWAARRGNYNAMCLLLDKGANPQLTTWNQKRNALHLAAQGNSLTCIQRLLQHRRSNQILDINARDVYGHTPLRIAAAWNCTAATTALIQYGADINAYDQCNEPPLFGAVYENAHETITQLLHVGADYTLKTRFANTILHFAANQSDEKTLTLLARARMRGVDTHAKNTDGITALELATAREANVSETWQGAFARLLGSVSAQESESDEEEEEVSLGSGSSGEESWKSFDEGVWSDAERAVEVNDREGEVMPGLMQISRGRNSGSETVLMNLRGEDVDGVGMSSEGQPLVM